MKTRFGMVASMAVVALAATACSASPDSQTQGGGTAATAGKAGTLTVAEATAGGEALEQIGSPWFNSGSLSQLAMFRGLFRAQPNLQDVKPDLAKDYNLSQDAKTLTVTLQDGLEWSDGQPLTGEDVAWSMAEILRVAKANAIYVSAFKQIEGADAINPGNDALLSGVSVQGNVITIKLTSPVSNIVPVLAQFMILPKHSLEKADPLKLDTDEYWKQPVTSGPFKVGELSQGNFITLVPNDKYEGIKPKITKINVVASADPAADAASGKIDLFTSRDTEVNKAMKSVDSFTANPVDTLFYRYFIFNLKDTNSPFANVEARKALTHAVDWKSLVSGLYPELGVVINSGVPEGFPGHDAQIPDYTFDPAKAKQMLEAAGFDFKKTVRLRYYYDDQTSINLMTAVAQQLMEVGMKVDVQKFQGDATSELYTNRKYDVAFKGLSAFSLGEWYAEYTNDPTFGQIVGQQPEFQKLNTQMNQATDEATVNSTLTALQALEQEKFLKFPIYSVKQYVFVAKRVGGATKFGNPLYLYDNNFANWTLS